MLLKVHATNLYLDARFPEWVTDLTINGKKVVSTSRPQIYSMNFIRTEHTYEVSDLIETETHEGGGSFLLDKKRSEGSNLIRNVLRSCFQRMSVLYIQDSYL